MELSDVVFFAFMAGVVTDLATGLGALPFFFVRSFSRRMNARMLALAAGMMVTASMVQLLGEAIHLTPGWQIWEVGAGLFAGGVFFKYITRWLAQNEDFDIGRLRETGGASALLIVMAMTLHSLPEGIAIGVAAGAASETGSLSFGLTIAIALAIHNIPEGLAISAALRSRGVSVWGCVGWSIVSSIPQIIGAPPAAAAVWIFQPLLPAGLGFAAGAMMFLVVDNLVVQARDENDGTMPALAFVVGLIVMLMLGRLFEIG